MADPFSIAAGTVGLLDVCWRVGSYLTTLNNSRGKIEQDIAQLSKEVNAITSANTSIQALWNAQKTHAAAQSMPDGIQIVNLWQNAGIVLEGCRSTMEKLNNLVKEIVGKGGQEVTGKRDGIKKVLRKQSKEKDVNEIRQQLLNYQSSLQVILTALSFAYARDAQSATGISLDHLSDKLESLGYKLQSEVASLRFKAEQSEDGYLRDSLIAATNLATKAPLNKHFHIPRAVSSIFTGRGRLLRDLKQDLDSSSSLQEKHAQRRFIIYGLGGSGKTEFCCKFAQDNRQSFWGVFYINASSRQSAKHTYANIAKIAGREPNELAAKTWLTELDRPWLLIIDNADDPSIDIEDYFPEGEGGVILVTTRNPHNRWHGTFGQRYYQFEKLDEEEATDLVLRSADASRTASALSSAAHIAKVLYYLPLALVQAGKAVMKRMCTLETYLEFYDRSWQRIRRARGKSADQQDKDDINMNVYSSYEILFRGLESTDATATRDAVELLKMFSFLSYEDIRIDFLMASVAHPRLKEEHDQVEAAKKAGNESAAKVSPKPAKTQQFKDFVIWAVGELQTDRSRPVLPAVLRDDDEQGFDEDRLADALDQLAQISLISYQDTMSGYSMHPLVHTWVRERPQMSTGDQAIWCQAAITTLTQSILLPPLDTLASAESLRRHLLPHVRHVQKCKRDIQFRFLENRKSRRKPFPVAASCFGKRHVWELAKFSWVYFQNGHFDEAEPLQLKIQQFVCGTLGLSHPSGRITTLFLAATYWHQTRTNKAAQLQEDVLKACESSLGPSHHQTLKDMDTLGASRCFQGRFRESRELHEKAITGLNKLLGPTHEDTLLAVDNLGRVMWRYFKYDEARMLHAKAVDGLTKCSNLGPLHEKTLVAKEGWAIAHLDTLGNLLHPIDDRPHPAHEIMLEVLEERKKRLGKEQPLTLLASCNLARIKCALGEHIEAERLLRATLPIAQRDLGEQHFGTIMGKTYLAQVLVGQQRYADAEKIFLEITRQENYERCARDDGEHPDRILAMWYLVHCYELHGKNADAVLVCAELVKAVTNIGGERLGLQHPFAKRLEGKIEELKLSVKRDQSMPSVTSILGASENGRSTSAASTASGKGLLIGDSLKDLNQIRLRVQQVDEEISPPPTYEASCSPNQGRAAETKIQSI